jgi:putative glutamine amidotransferase
MKPRIAIPVPTTSDHDYNQRSWQSYADSVFKSGGEPVRLELNLSPSELRDLATTCQGVCLPGSPADVAPALYGAEADPATAPADPAREACDYFLLEDAEKYGKPVLAICFGVQSLNTWRGGTLVQDLTPVPVNQSAGNKVAVAHAVLVPGRSLLGAILQESVELQAEAPAEDGYLRLPVNSSHHQAVATPGDGLRIVARCPDDGVIEAVENDPDWAGENHPSGRSHQFLLGVQWHPERSYDISAASRALFARLISEASRLAENPS